VLLNIESSPEFEADLRALLAKHIANVTLVEPDRAWTVDRAHRYYLALPPRAKRILREAVIRDGFVPAEDLREEGRGLRGHSGPLTIVLERGVRKGWWPDKMEPPVQHRGPGFGPVVGYLMPNRLVPIFEEAIVDSTHQEILTAAITTHGGTWDPARAVTALREADRIVDPKRVRAVLRRIAATGLIVKTDPDRAIYRLAAEQ
jgi:hypothetical protein